MYDPSKIGSNAGNVLGGPEVFHNETSSPRWEAEATYATNFDGGNVKFFLSGLWQDAERTISAADRTAKPDIKDDATATGVAGGIVLGFQGVEFVASGYTGEALGTILMLDFDSVDRKR